MKQICLTLSFISFFIFLSGCATPARKPPTFFTPKEIPRAGIYHKVKWGETTWRIARIYGVTVDDIVQANELPNAAKVETGQLLFIPGVVRRKEITPSARPGSTRFIWPVRGEITTAFGNKKHGVTSKGIEISTPENVPVYAVRAGEVVFCSDTLKGYGKVVIIDHRDGFSTVYAHNSENLVRPGDEVRQGETIAKVGRTGRTDSPCLYFEIRKGHAPQNPLSYLP